MNTGRCQQKRRWRSLSRCAALLCAALLSGMVAARSLELRAGEPLPTLQSGDLLRLLPGVHRGPWRIDTPNVMLLASTGVTLDGGGVGSALRIEAAGVRVEGLHIIGVGPNVDLYEPDAAVSAVGADGLELIALSAGDRANGVSAGIHLENSANVRIDHPNLYGSREGPGITSYLTPDLNINGGHIEGFMDGIYLERSDGAQVRGVRIEGSTRYGLHVMFSIGVTLERNQVVGGGVGSAVMYGRAATIRDNLLSGHHGPMAFGLLVQEEQLSLLEGNRVERNTIGVLMVAAEGAQLHANAIEHNGIGVLIDRAPIGFETARSSVTLRGQRFVGNAADLAVAEEGAALTLRGNSFDRAPPFDLDGDGVLELPFVATSAFAAFAARTPDLLLLAYGPGITLWQQLERSVPGWRVAPFADPTPRRASDSPPPLQASLPSATLAVLLGVSALLSAAPWGMRRSR